MPSSFTASGTATSTSVQGKMTNAAGTPFQGVVKQGPPNWQIEFKNLPNGTYTLEVWDPNNPGDKATSTNLTIP